VEQQRKRAGNVLAALPWYGLTDQRTLRLTPFAQSLLDEVDDDVRNQHFAAYLLKNAAGLTLLDVVRTLRGRREPVDNKSVAAELRKRSYQLTTNSGDPGKLRQWLGQAGIVSDDWHINEERFAEIAGTTLTNISAWQGLTRTQRAFLIAIRKRAEGKGSQPISSPELLALVRGEGASFDEAQVRAKVYRPLSQGGWIEHSAPGGGRGGKGGIIQPTDQLLSIDLELVAGFGAGELPADVRAQLATPLDEVYVMLGSNDTYLKGIGLELLTLNLASDLGLVPLQLRVRGVQTGGAEVDLIAEATHLHFSRWLFQCKNTKTVNVSVLAREIGMATLLQAQVVVIATTGRFTSTLKTYAERVSETTPFQVVLVDGSGLDEYRNGGSIALRHRFSLEAASALQLKRPQVLETLQELGDDNE
jgi:hypothetical protein